MRKRRGKWGGKKEEREQRGREFRQAVSYELALAEANAMLHEIFGVEQ